MATSLFQPITVVSNNRNSRIKAASSSSSSSSSKWWIPIFGWSSSDPDYIVHNPTDTETSDPDPDHGNRSRFAPGCFTEEKAKQLRMKTTETANFHDIMYHSAIASRLASDVSGRHHHRHVLGAETPCPRCGEGIPEDEITNHVISCVEKERNLMPLPSPAETLAENSPVNPFDPSETLTDSPAKPFDPSETLTDETTGSFDPSETLTDETTGSDT